MIDKIKSSYFDRKKDIQLSFIDYADIISILEMFGAQKYFDKKLDATVEVETEDGILEQTPMGVDISLERDELSQNIIWYQLGNYHFAYNILLRDCYCAEGLHDFYFQRRMNASYWHIYSLSDFILVLALIKNNHENIYEYCDNILYNFRVKFFSKMLLKTVIPEHVSNPQNILDELDRLNFPHLRSDFYIKNFINENNITFFSSSKNSNYLCWDNYNGQIQTCFNYIYEVGAVLDSSKEIYSIKNKNVKIVHDYINSILEYHDLINDASYYYVLNKDYIDSMQISSLDIGKMKKFTNIKIATDEDCQHIFNLALEIVNQKDNYVKVLK